MWDAATSTPPGRSSRSASILSCLGQGAWLLANAGNADLLAIEDLNPFFQMLPEMVRPFGVLLSTCAAIIASQALVTGAFSSCAEAKPPRPHAAHADLHYPAETKGPSSTSPWSTTSCWVGCVIVVLLFQSSAHMEAAYGLAITITMICTSLLLFFYLHGVRKMKAFPWVFVIFFVALESCFFVSLAHRFFHGGYFTILMAALMACWPTWRIGWQQRQPRRAPPVHDAARAQLPRPASTACAPTRTTGPSATALGLPHHQHVDRHARPRHPVLHLSTSAPSALTPTGSSTSRSPSSAHASSTPSRTTGPTTSSACTCTWATRSTSA
ncbi:MAG: KUP/HAK/KT family potassium transporter [Collinsella sp.]